MNKEQIKDVLAKFSLFQGLSEQEIYKIVDISISREWNKGSHVFLQDEPLEDVNFINVGKIKIYKTDVNGKRRLVSILKSGEMFPHVGFFRKGGYPALCELTENSVLRV